MFTFICNAMSENYCKTYSSGARNFVWKKHFCDIAAERIKREYKNFIENKQVIVALENFDEKTDHLDVFFMNLFTKIKCSTDFEDFICRLMILFHGNAAVERSFSFNKQFLGKFVGKLARTKFSCPAFCTRFSH